MTVYFIGAGPGDPELITVKGKRLIESCNVCLYAGSLVPKAVVACAPSGAHVADTARMHLEEIVATIAAAHGRGEDIARVHSGDPSIFGAIGEQMRRLDELRIPCEIVPGVPAFAAAAAAMGQELTVPEETQTVILTRTSMKSTAMPEHENLDSLGATGALLVIHLSVRNSREIQRRLVPQYGPDCPTVLAYRIGWPEQAIIRTVLGRLHDEIRKRKFTRTALIFVGRSLNRRDFKASALYDPAHPHVLRPFVGGGKGPIARPRKSGARKNR
ncbi:MAG: precorrin-4 C(11)-methyltransferase [Albidovulum sp.]|nr:precorrin-4 C(11)-methyltransferase [Albidovulum sp.]